MSPIKRSRCWSISLIICLFTLVHLPLTGQCADQTATLTILYTNDIHGHSLPFSYDDMGNLQTSVGGAARRAALIRQIKNSVKNPVLVLDAGDLFTRGPLDDLRGVPDFEVINAIPYDAMTLGNNEFKSTTDITGYNILRERLKQARISVICANVFDKATGERLLPPYKIFETSGLKIAVFGLLTARNSTLPQYAGVRVDDPIGTAKQIVPELRSKADLVVALTHLGCAQDLTLAASVPGIDVIIGGDSHTWLFKPILLRRSDPAPDSSIGGALICQDGEWGKSLGRLDLQLRKASDTGCRVTSYSGDLIDINSSIQPAADIAAIIDSAAKPLLREVCKNAAEVPQPKAADWVASVLREAAGTQVAVEPSEDVENGIKPGIVSALDIRQIFPFVNGIDKLVVTGKQLRSFVLSQTDPGLSGLKWQDGTLYVGSDKLTDTKTYTLALEDYYASHSRELSGAQITPLGKTTVEAVTGYITTHCSRD